MEMCFGHILYKYLPVYMNNYIVVFIIIEELSN